MRKSQEIIGAKETEKPSSNPVYPHCWPPKNTCRDRLHTTQQKQKIWIEIRAAAYQVSWQFKTIYEFYLFHKISVFTMSCTLRQDIAPSLRITLLSRLSLSSKLHFTRGSIGHWSHDFKHTCVIKFLFFSHATQVSKKVSMQSFLFLFSWEGVPFSWSFWIVSWTWWVMEILDSIIFLQ